MTSSTRVIELGAQLPTRLLRRLPHRLAVPLLARRMLTRQDTVDRRRWNIDDRLRVEAYWLRFGGSEGAALSVCFDGEEFLRIDGLARHPHLHYCVAQSLVRSGDDRVRLPETTDEDLIERACFELANNLGYALHLHRRRVAQRHHVDHERVGLVADEVGEHLRALVARHRSQLDNEAAS